MKRGGWADDMSVLHKMAKNRVIRTSVLRGMGVGAKTIVDRTSGGPWQRILPGLVLLHNGPPSRLQRNTAAVMYGGGSAMLTGRAGLVLHGFSTEVNTTGVPLLISHDRHRKDVSFVEVERTWRLPEPLQLSGLPVAPLERCLLDAARRIGDDRKCTALIAEVLQRGAVDIDGLFVELNDGSGRGSAVPRRVLRDLSLGAHSVAEADARILYEKAGLPSVLYNYFIYDARGNLLGSPDAWVDAVGFGHQVDSFQYHSSPADYEKTLQIRAGMQSKGIIISSHTPKTIRTQPNLVVDEIRKAYEQALARPRPNVSALSRAEAGYAVAS